jgi:hypothetical protein
MTKQFSAHSIPCKLAALPFAVIGFAAILTLSLGLAATDSFAAHRGDRGDGHGMRSGAPYAHAMAPMAHPRALARLHDELKLDAQQEALWKEARSFVGEHHDAIRARWYKDQAEIRALLDQPGVDLRVVAKRMDELRADGFKQRDAARERWFAVYDSLDAGPKEKARLFFKDGMERMGRHMTDRTKDRPGRGHRRHNPPPASASASPAAQ